MTQGRSLGGGRVLGSGRHLSSPALSPQPRARHVRNTRPLSPSESSLSLSSQTSASPASTAEPKEDIGSKVLLGAPDHAAASASTRLVCPICNEDMVTLLQLNRHLDDTHQNLVEEEQDEVKNWFETQMKKAKRFQPLAVLNQKLKGLDVFESNDAPALAPSLPSNPAATPAPEAPMVRRDPDEEVTRTHWQRPSYRDACSDPMCARPITAGPQLALSGNSTAINCRCCGKLFCEEHTMYQMKLSRQATHDPVRGFWCRVCETCYKSREGYNDHRGFERDHFADFQSIRRKKLDREHMEMTRLEKRLSKLTQLLANPPPLEENTGSGFWPLSGGAKAQRKTLEQTIIAWEEDAKVPSCPFCQQEFSTYTFRRHHCRLCGRVVCGDPKTGCSSEVGLNVAAAKSASEKSSSNHMSIDVRMCKDCSHTLFSKADFERELAQRPADQRAYENLVQFERGIRLLLPRFHKLLHALQDPDRPPTQLQLADATKVRKRLMDAFGQYDNAARRIRDFPTQSPTQKKLQEAVYRQAYSFLSTHMLPLRSLPKALKHAAPHGSKTSGRPGGGALAAIKYNNLDAPSVASSSSAVSALESEEKELRERLIVLEEQKFMVSEMVSDATKHRRFDEMSSLAQNLEDLSQEIDHINNQLGQLDFAGAYERNIGSPTPG